MQYPLLRSVVVLERFLVPYLGVSPCTSLCSIVLQIKRHGVLYPNSIKFTRISSNAPAQTYVRNGLVYVPRIKTREELVTRPAPNWIASYHKSRSLLETPLNYIRNRTLRSFVRYAQQNAVTMDDKLIVYVVVHARSRRFYIGSTTKTCMERLKTHYYKRNASHHSELSHFMRMFSDEDWSSVFVFPVFTGANLSKVQQVEKNFIDRYSHQSGMLNRNEKFVRQRTSNRRPPTTQPRHLNLRDLDARPDPAAAIHPQRSLSVPKDIRPQEQVTTQRIISWLQNKQQDCALRYVASLSRRRLRFALEFARTSVADIEVGNFILAEIEKRRCTPKAPKKYFLKVFYARRIGNISMQKILFQGCPLPQDILSDTRVSVRLNSTLGSFACNTSRTSIVPPSGEYECFCDLLRRTHNLSDKHFRHGHLATDDVTAVLPLLKPEPSVVDEVQVVWTQGAKFRSALCVSTAKQKLANSLDAFVSDVLESVPLLQLAEINRELLDAWKSEAVLRYERACQDPNNFVVSTATKHLVSRLSTMFVISVIDKNTQGLALLCKQDYAKRLSDHMSSPTYERSTKQISEILELHKQFNRRFRCRFVPALPYIYIIPKLHKEPARPFDRFIAGLSHLNRQPSANKREPSQLPSSSTHHCSRRISDFFNAVIDVLLLQDRTQIQKHEPKRVWIIRDPSEAVCVLRHSKKLQTHDFSTMYTNFPLDALKHAVTAEVHIAMKFLASKYFKVDDFTKIMFVPPKKDCKVKAIWQYGQPSPQGFWGCKEVLEAFEFLVDNSYFSNAFGVVRQIVGVAMGSPHSPPAANLGLTHAERSFVDRTLALKGADYVRQHLRNFMPFLRYIDDLAHEFPEFPSKDDYYGMEVVLTGSAPPADSINLLSYNFRISSYSLQVAFKNKQQGFPIILTRYPGRHSTISSECRIGSVVAGLVSIYRFIDSPLLFADAVKEFFDVLRARGFTYYDVRSGIIKAVTRECRSEYQGFLFSHFFADILSRWPRPKNDPPLNRLQEEERLRRDTTHHVPPQSRHVPVPPGPPTQPNVSRFHQATAAITQDLADMISRPTSHLLHRFIPPFGFSKAPAPPRQPQPPEPLRDSESDDDRFEDCLEQQVSPRP